MSTFSIDLTQIVRNALAATFSDGGTHTYKEIAEAILADPEGRRIARRRLTELLAHCIDTIADEDQGVAFTNWQAFEILDAEGMT